MRKTFKEYAIINHPISEAEDHVEDVLFFSQDKHEIVKKLIDCQCTDEDSTVEIYEVYEDGDFAQGSDFDEPSNFIKNIDMR